ncbi:hypothetical protein ACQ86D_04380 [Streptomyces galilaeus]
MRTPDERNRPDIAVVVAARGGTAGSLPALAGRHHRTADPRPVAGRAAPWRKIVGVVAANDGTGGGAVAAFKAAGVTPCRR